MRKLIIFLITIILLGSCSPPKESKGPEYLKYVNEISRDFAKDMKKKYNLYCSGSGGSMPKDVEKIKVLFTSYSEPTINNARKIEVSAVQELLKRINNHEKIRPFLREYPFDASRVGISISFRTKNNNYPLNGSIAYVSIGKSKIFYYTAEIKMSEPIPLTRIDRNNEWTKEIIPGELREKLVDLMNEPYEEALKIVEAESKAI